MTTMNSKKTLERVLYVEDDPDIRVIANLALVMVGGLTVEVCASGAEAIARAQQFAPELLLLDVMMPDMDGPQTLAALRLFPELAVTPAVFMTAKVQATEVAHYLSLGALDVIRKPFDPMTLAQRLKDLWRGAAA